MSISKGRLVGFATGVIFLTLPLGGQPPTERKSVQASFRTRVETEAEIDVLSYRLEFFFPWERPVFSGIARIRLRLIRGGVTHRIRLDQVGLTTDSVHCGGHSVPFVHDEKNLWIPLSYPEDTIEVVVYYRGASPERGLYFYDRCVYTFSEPQDARYWFPCHDVPSDKATAELIVTVPKGVEVASVGRLVERTLDLDGRFETFHWKTEFPVATYLICLTMSKEYVIWQDQGVTAQGDTIPMPYYLFPEDTAKARVDVAHLPQALFIFSRYFGPYPFEKYGTAEVVPFPVGGMEHQTMTTVHQNWFRGNRSLEYGFVHELAHMWWGDAVTLSDWPHIWLNESFATYSEALFFESFYGAEAYRDKLRYCRQAYFDQAKRADFPLYDPPDGELFNWGIVYNKGALVLHQLRRVLGDTVFFNGLSTYYDRFCYGNASTEDFRAVCETVSGQGLGWFFDQWVYGGGHPVLTYGWYARLTPAGTYEVFLHVDQEEVYRLPLVAGCYSKGRRTDLALWVTGKKSGFVWEMPWAPDSLVLDPDRVEPIAFHRLPMGPRLSEGNPDRSNLDPPFPNPGRGEMTVYYAVASPEETPVRMVISDPRGRRVRTLFESRLPPGAYWTVWDGRDDRGSPVSAGLYLITLWVGKERFTRKALVVR